MLISIIVPTRNRSAELVRTLHGIAEQSYGNFEVVVLDDGSNTETRAYYASTWNQLDSRFKLFFHGGDGVPGVGPSAARNLAIGHAVGDVIAFCDDDDFWCEPQHLASVAQVFASRADIDMYIANQSAVSVDGSVKAEWLPKLGKLLTNRTHNPDGTFDLSIDDMCASGGFPQLNAWALRSTVVRQIGGFWDALTYEGDRDFFWRALDKCRGVIYTPKTIAQHNVPDPNRQNNQSTSHLWVERWLISTLVSNHIITSANNRSIVQLATRYKGDLLRKLALNSVETGSHLRAFQFGRQALAARFSVKWALYMAWLWARNRRQRIC